MNGRVGSLEICICVLILFQQGEIECIKLHTTDISFVKNMFDWRLNASIGRDHWNVANFDWEHVLKARTTRSCNHQAICFLSYVISRHRVSKLSIEGCPDTTLIYSNELVLHRFSKYQHVQQCLHSSFLATSRSRLLSLFKIEQKLLEPTSSSYLQASSTQTSRQGVKNCIGLETMESNVQKHSSKRKHMRDKWILPPASLQILTLTN